MFFEKRKNLLSKLFLIFFEDVFVIDEIIFVDEKHHPFFDNKIPLFIRIEGDKSIILSDLNIEIFVISAKFVVGVCDDFLKQIRYFCDSLIISGNITHQTKHSRFEDMTKKRVPQSFAFCCAFYQSRNIYHIEICILCCHRT